jgi:hypothetical protein
MSNFQVHTDTAAEPGPFVNRYLLATAEAAANVTWWARRAS